MKVLLDSNIILDALAHRLPFAEHAQTLMVLAAEGQYEACLTANSFTDIAYILRKYLSDGQCRAALGDLLQTLTVIAVGAAQCEAALSSSIPDIEDALLMACALRARVDYVITRDAKLLAVKDAVPSLTPEDLLAQFLS